MEQWKNTTSCPTEKQEYLKRGTALGCGEGNEYHCILNQLGAPGQLCTGRSWIQPGHCPEYNTVSKRVDVFPCKKERRACPSATYWSNTSFQYSGCNAQKSDDKVKQDDVFPIPVIAAAVASVVVVILIMVVIAICIYRRHRSYSGNSDIILHDKERKPLTQEDLDKMFQRGSDLIMRHRKDSTYKRTTAVDVAKQSFDENNIAVIKGILGSGKTKTVLEVASLWMSEGRGSRKVAVFESLEELANLDLNLLRGKCIILDNCFTRWAFDSVQTFLPELCVNLSKMTRKGSDTKLLITVDTHIYEHNGDDLGKYKIFKKSYSVEAMPLDMKGFPNLDEDTKITILNGHLKSETSNEKVHYEKEDASGDDKKLTEERHLLPNDELVLKELVSNVSSNVGFPSMCAMFSKIPACFFEKGSRKKFFAKCESLLTSILNSMETSKETTQKQTMFCINYAMLRNREIDMDVFSVEDTISKRLARIMEIKHLTNDMINVCLQSNQSVWFTKKFEDRNVFIISERAVFESCLKAWIRNREVELIELCSPQLLKECIRGKHYAASSGECVYVAKIETYKFLPEAFDKTKQYELLARRFQELLPENCDLRHHPLMKDEKFCRIYSQVMAENTKRADRKRPADDVNIVKET